MPLLGNHALTAGLVLAIAGLGWSIVFGPGGLRRLQALRVERQQLTDQALALMAENHRLDGEIERLQHDDAYLEQIARRDLHLVRPNELVFRFGRRAGE